MAEPNFLLADQPDEHPNLHAIVKDAERFLLSNIDIVQRAPQQTYASALVFSPYESQIRKENLAHYPTWFKYGPVVDDHWGPVLQTLQCQSTLQRHSIGVTALAFSFDGNYLASLYTNGELLLWDAMTGTLHSTLMEGHGSYDLKIPVSRPVLAFSCNGQLAFLSSAWEVQIWEPVTGVICRRIIHAEHREVVAIAFAVDDTLAVSYKGSPAQTWIYKAGALSTLVETKTEVNALSFLSEGTLALVCSASGSRTHECEIFLYNPMKSTKEPIPGTGFTAASFSSNGQLALFQWNQYGESIHVYDLGRKSCQTSKWFASHVLNLVFSSNERGLFFVTFDGSVQLLNLESGITTVIWTGPSPIWPNLIAPAPDGRLAIASRFAPEIRILEVQSESLLSNDDPTNGSASTERNKVWRRLQKPVPRSSTLTSGINSIAFSPDGKWLVYASDEGIHILDSATQRELRFLQIHNVQRHDFHSITTNGNHLAASISDVSRTILVWNPASGKVLKELNSKLGSVAAVAFSPNDSILLAADYLTGAVNVWDTVTWGLQRTLEVRDENLDESLAGPRPIARLQSIAFSQNGKRIAFLYRNSLSIWDAEQYFCLQNIKIEFPRNNWWENQISVFAEDSYIDTTFGRVYLDQPPDDNGLWKVEDARWRVYGDWLYRDGKRLLWLPPDFRPQCTAIYDDLFVMGHESGKVTFFEGNNHDSAPEPAYQTTAPESGSKASIEARESSHQQGRRAGKQKT